MTDISGYFDYAAATPMDSRVFDVMTPYMIDNFFNPSAQYLPAREVKKVIDNARSSVAGMLGAKPAEISFTAGGTEANNMAIYGIMERFPDCNVVVSAIEHESVLEPARRFNYKGCPVLPSGMVNLDKFSSLIDDQTVLVSVMYANNEIGTIQPLRKVWIILDEIRKDRLKRGIKTPLYFHSDASQAGNYLDLHVHRIGVDMMTLNSGKIYGPKQSGVLYVRGGIELKPLIVGGGQERNVRSGTENVAGIAGLTRALEITIEMKLGELERIQKLQQLFVKTLYEKIPRATVNGSMKARLPNNVHVTFPGQDNERLMMLLDEKSFYVAIGSACSASREEPSHVLSAIGLKESDIHGSLRFSMGRYTSEDSVIRLIDALRTVLA